MSSNNKDEKSKLIECVKLIDRQTSLIARQEKVIEGLERLNDVQKLTIDRQEKVIEELERLNNIQKLTIDRREGKK
jgi:uncharacterized coiled-coil protein SlyX